MENGNGDARQDRAGGIGDGACEHGLLRKCSGRNSEGQSCHRSTDEVPSSFLLRWAFQGGLKTCRFGGPEGPPLPGCGYCACVVDNPPADHRQQRLDVLDLIRGNGEVVAIEHDEIRELARLDRAEVAFLEDEERIAPRVAR